MNNASKEIIIETLRKAMNKEDLNTRATAKALNLNPCYVSMAQNPNSWDSMGKAPWVRLTEWFNARVPILKFEVPEGETIWVPKAKPEKTNGEVVDIKKSNKTEIPKFHEKPAKEISIEDKPLKFNYDFLKDTKFMNIKEKEAEFMDFIGRLIEKKIKEFHIPASLEATVDPTHVKVALDIEINLVLNGQKVRLN
jgi:hypothetical protein